MQLTRNRLAGLALVVGVVALAGCQVDSQTGTRTLTGAGVGAAGGAVTGLFLKNANPLEGALVGAAAGAASGFVYDQIKKN